MKHTGAKPLVWLGLAVALQLSQGLWAQASRDTQTPTVRELLERVRAREKAVKSVEIEFSIQDRFPDNRRFESRGSLRVLQGTHFYTAVEVSFDDEVRSEMQTVVTPEGVWTRRKDPIEEVYLFTNPKLRKEMELKTRRLGETAPLPGPMSAPSAGVLGGAMLLALSRQFDLKVTDDRNDQAHDNCDNRFKQPDDLPHPHFGFLFVVFTQELCHLAEVPSALGSDEHLSRRVRYDLGRMQDARQSSTVDHRFQHVVQ